MTWRAWALGAAVALASTFSASAAVVIHTWQAGGNVYTQHEGTIDTTGVSLSSIAASVSYIVPGYNTYATFSVGDLINPAAVSSSTGLAGVSTTPITASSSFGDPFGISSLDPGDPSGDGGIILPVGYTSGDYILGGMQFTGQSLLSMGFFSSVINYTLVSGDTVTWNIGTAPPPSIIPLPAGLPLVAAGLGALVVLRRRKQAA